MNNTLEAKNLKKSFKKRTVVTNVSVQVSSGECVGLLGPNGAGKTTSFYMIVGLQACDNGEILLNGQTITKKTIDQRARLGIGYLPQEASVFRKMSVEDNIYSILELQKELNREQRKSRLEQLLTDFNIHHIRKSLGMSLSGGERRRVEIARALASSPKFILLDEPFAGVDPISVGDIKKIITQLCKRNIGVLITDHNVRETLDICDRAYIVNKGEILCQGDTETILSNQDVRKVYLGQEFAL
jgi:lipopolysaccharide export system ATP-binding protein